MKRIVAFGCSFTQGVGISLATPYTVLTPDAGAWPQQTANKLNWRCDNRGEGGTSIKDVVLKIVNYDFQPDDVVCIMWPDMTRTMFLPGHNWEPEVRSDRPLNIAAHKNDRPSLTYFGKYYSDNDAMFTALVNINFALSYLKKINIPAFNLLVNEKPLNEHKHDLDGCFTFLEKYKNLDVEWIECLVHRTGGEPKRGTDGKHYHRQYHAMLGDRLAQKLPNLLDKYTN